MKTKTLATVLATSLLGATLSACSTTGNSDTAQHYQRPNCELPSQARKMGKATFLAPRERIVASPAECHNRGGLPLIAATD